LASKRGFFLPAPQRRFAMSFLSYLPYAAILAPVALALAIDGGPRKRKRRSNDESGGGDFSDWSFGPVDSGASSCGDSDGGSCGGDGGGDGGSCGGD
jgi:hypothetical protein